jgi:hypothetical protein
MQRFNFIVNAVGIIKVCVTLILAKDLSLRKDN